MVTFIAKRQTLSTYTRSFPKLIPTEKKKTKKGYKAAVDPIRLSMARLQIDRERERGIIITWVTGCEKMLIYYVNGIQI